jgi:hypothetical protein
VLYPKIVFLYLYIGNEIYMTQCTKLAGDVYFMKTENEQKDLTFKYRRISRIMKLLFGHAKADDVL